MAESDKNKKPTAIYLRRSTDRQEQSLEIQRQAVVRYAEQNGYEIIREYMDDAISGASTRGRDGFNELMRDAANPKCLFRFVLVYDLSRFSRANPFETMSQIHALQLNGVKFISAMDPLPGNEWDPLFVVQLSMVSYQEVKKTSWKTIDGQVKNAMEGKWQGGTPPYGYDLKYYDSHKKPLRIVRFLESGEKQVLNPNGSPNRMLVQGEKIPKTKSDYSVLILSLNERVEVIRRIFRMYLQGHGFKAIAKKLNGEGIPSPRNGNWSKNVHACWSEGTVRSILMNELYTGSFIWNRSSQGKFNSIKNNQANSIESDRRSDAKRPRRKNDKGDRIVIRNRHPAIVDRDTFEKVQKTISKRGGPQKENSFHSGRAKDAPYLLVGLIHCSHCDHPYYGQKKHKGKRRKDGSKVLTYCYVCSGYLRKGTTLCRGTAISKDEIDNQILDLIDSRISPFLKNGGRKVLEAIILKELKSDSRDPKREMAQLTNKIHEADRKIDTLIDKVLDQVSDANRELFDQKLTKLREQRDSLEAQLEELKSMHQQSVDVTKTAKEIVAVMAGFSDLFAVGTLEEQKEFVRLFIEDIKLDGNKRKAIVRIRKFPALNGIGTGKSSFDMVAGAGFEPATFGL